MEHQLPILNEKQKMLFPQELEVWYILPAIRKELSRALIRTGLSQKKVAGILGITEAAVSQYKKDKRATEFVFSDDIKIYISEAAERVRNSPASIFREIMYIDNHLKQTGIFCQLHRLKSWTPNGCEKICAQNFFRGNND